VSKYRTAMNVFGMGVGETFESNDPGWEDHVKAGNIVRVDEEKPAPVLLSKKEHDKRVAAGDTEPVKPGEVYREKVEAGGDDGGQRGDDK
jgi:hypothetical protein